MKYHELQDPYRNLAETLAEALDAAYVSDKKPPYTVPYVMSGDLFKFTTAKDHREAIELIREATAKSVSRLIPPPLQGGSANPGK